MTDQPEELTPILIPFEKAAPPKNAGLPQIPSDKEAKSGKKSEQLAMGLGGLNTFIGGLATAGEATRNLVQGILDPGLVGQKAAAGAAEAAGTMTTPTKQTIKNWSDWNDAAASAHEGKAARAAQAANANTSAQRESMIQQAKDKFVQAQNKAGVTDIYAPNLDASKYQTFLDSFSSDFQNLVQSWVNSGVDPALIKEIRDIYLHPLDTARDRYGEYIDKQGHERNQLTADRDLADSLDQEQNVAQAMNNARQHQAAISTYASGINPMLLERLNRLSGAKEYGEIPGLTESYINYFVDKNGRHITDDNFDESSIHLDMNSLDENMMRRIEDLDPMLYTQLKATSERTGLDHLKNVETARQMGQDRYVQDNLGNVTDVDLGVDENGDPLRLKSVDGYFQKGLSLAWGRYGKDLGLDDDDLVSFLSKDHKGLASISPDDAKVMNALLERFRQDPSRPLEKIMDIHKKLDSGAALDNDEWDLLQIGEVMNLLSAKSLIFKDMEKNLTGDSYSYGSSVEEPDKFDLTGTSYVQDILGRARTPAMRMYQEALTNINKEYGKFTRFIEMARSGNPGARLIVTDGIRSAHTDPELSEIGGAIGGAFHGGLNDRYDAALEAANRARAYLGFDTASNLAMDTGESEDNIFSPLENAIIHVGNGIVKAVGGNGEGMPIVTAGDLDRLGLPHASEMLTKYNYGMIDTDTYMKNRDEIENWLDGIEQRIAAASAMGDVSVSQSITHAKGFLAAFRVNLAASLSGTMREAIDADIAQYRKGKNNKFSWKAPASGKYVPPLLKELGEKWYAMRNAGLQGGAEAITRDGAYKEVYDLLNGGTDLLRVGLVLTNPTQSDIYGMGLPRTARIRLLGGKDHSLYRGAIPNLDTSGKVITGNVQDMRPIARDRGLLMFATMLADHAAGKKKPKQSP